MEIVQVDDFESKHSTRNKASDKLKTISNMLSIKEVVIACHNPL
jgi:hypothetical protein